MPIITEEDWEDGVSTGSDVSEKIMDAFRALGTKKGMDMAEVKTTTGLKWIFGHMKKLVEAGKLERKKFGKRYAYRLVVE
jgi:hypothetical protein